ncbi:glycoprotein family protein [Trifolium pratense]|uniref:Glycoprotein family protein n=1 Tax=Trifolium pratense TaxID=57577 RepID=A0A2K3NL65_TRIPR|nr:glycoprotein family protein [Trifolium pratense]
MPRVVGVAVSKGFKAVQDLELLKLFKSEINFELSSNHFQNAQIGSLGEFVVDSDSPQHSKDVILRRKSDSGEEVALSAILGPPNYEKDHIFIRDVFMKFGAIVAVTSSLLATTTATLTCSGTAGSVTDSGCSANPP